MLVSMTKNMTIARQQGVALIMSLVILMILALLGISSMNTSNLQLLMTGNSQYQTVALNTAEDVIRTAEKYVVNYLNGDEELPATGFYNIPNGDTPINITELDWTDENKVVTEGTSQYVIEYTGDRILDSASLSWRQHEGVTGDSVSVFRITARTPSSRGSVRYVQSVLVTLQSPLTL